MGKRKQKGTKGRGSHVEGRRMLHLASSLKPYFIVFTASTCGMVIEIVAARILAPNIGVSLYTWTTIIGIVLAGISIGNYLGGRLADRFPSPTTLGFILMASGILSLSVLPLVKIISENFQALPIIPRIVFLTTMLFFLPSLALGMVTPVVIKLRLRDLSHTGNVVGKIYAISTVGGIFGTFITGFVLIQWIGTRAIILLVALLLVFMALAFGSLWRAKGPTLACLLLLLSIGGLSIPSRALNSDYLVESNYYSIRVEDSVMNGRVVKNLRLDAMVHSIVSLEDPTFLVDSYEKVFADIATYVAQRNPSLRVLFIGGGGYVMPQYLEEVYPQSTLEVIEIDPEVTNVAFEYLGLSPDTFIVTYNEDARMVVPKLSEGQYNLVFGDAFNDLSVPYHLTTREFNEQIRVLLKNDGIYAVNVVDKLHSGRFLRAYVNTLQQTFPYVYLIRDSADWEDDTPHPHVVVGSLQPLSSTALSEANTQAGRGQPSGYITSEDTLTSWLNAQRKLFLTDDYAPVDNLVVAFQLEKRGLSEAEEHYNAASELASQGRFEEAIAEYDGAIHLDPQYTLAYMDRGTVYFNLGQLQPAVEDYNKAIHLDPQFTLAYVNRGAAYFNLGQLQRAVEDYNKAIQLDPQFTVAYINRGLAYTVLGQFQRAIQDYDEAIRLEPNNAWAYAVRALAYTRLNMDMEAQQDFDQAVSLGYDSSLLKMKIEEAKR